MSCEFLEDFLRSERVEILCRASLRAGVQVLMQLGHACTTSSALLPKNDQVYAFGMTFDQQAGSSDKPEVGHFHCFLSQ